MAGVLEQDATQNPGPSIDDDLKQIRGQTPAAASSSSIDGQLEAIRATKRLEAHPLPPVAARSKGSFVLPDASQDQQVNRLMQGNLPSRVAGTGLYMIKHPAETMVGMAEAPVKAAMTGARFMGQSAAEVSLPPDIAARALADPQRIDESDAAVAGLQLTVPTVAGAMTGIVGRTIGGAGTGAVYMPDDPALGAVVGGMAGLAHGAIADDPYAFGVRVLRRPGAPAPAADAVTDESKLLPRRQQPTAKATVVDQPTEPPKSPVAVESIDETLERIRQERAAAPAAETSAAEPETAPKASRLRAPAAPEAEITPRSASTAPEVSEAAETTPAVPETRDMPKRSELPKATDEEIARWYAAAIETGGTHRAHIASLGDNPAFMEAHEIGARPRDQKRDVGTSLRKGSGRFVPTSEDDFGGLPEDVAGALERGGLPLDTFKQHADASSELGKSQKAIDALETELTRRGIEHADAFWMGQGVNPMADIPFERGPTYGRRAGAKDELALFGGDDLFGRPTSMAESDVGTGGRLRRPGVKPEEKGAISAEEMAARRDELGAPKSETEETAKNDAQQGRLFERQASYAKPDRIEAAAVRVGGHVYSGQTHWDALQKARGGTADPSKVEWPAESDQGYVTNKGQYLTREEAVDWADALYEGTATRQGSESFLPELRKKYAKLDRAAAFETKRAGATGGKVREMTRYLAPDRNSRTPPELALPAAAVEAERPMRSRAEIEKEEAGWERTRLQTASRGTALKVDPVQLDMFELGKADLESERIAFGSTNKQRATVSRVKKEAGKLADFTAAGAPTAAQRLGAIKKVSRAWVDIRGQKVNGPADIHRLMAPFRDPQNERLHAILLDDNNRVLSHTMETSGAINYVDVGNPKRWLQQMVDRAKRLGATRVVLSHNHPSGDPTASTDDKNFTYSVKGTLQRQGSTLDLLGHYVIDHGTGTWIETGPIGPTIYSHTAESDIGESADWTKELGQKIHSVNELHKLVRAGESPDHLTVAYLSSQNRVVAAEPHDIGKLPTLGNWLPKRMRALGARTVVLIGPRDIDIGHINRLVKFELGDKILDVGVPIVGGDGVVRIQSMEMAGRFHSGEPVELPDRERPRRVFEKVVPFKGADGEAKELGGAIDGVKKIFAPAARSPQAGEIANITRERLGTMMMELERSREALLKYARAFDKAKPGVRLSFIFKMEAGNLQGTPASREAARIIRTLLDTERKAIQELGTGKLEQWIENYFPHIWKRAKASIVGKILGKRPLQGPKSFLKKRTIPTTAEGMFPKGVPANLETMSAKEIKAEVTRQKGLEPVTDNPIELVLLKLREMKRYRMAHEIFKEAKGYGLVHLVRSGQMAPDGYVRINDSIAKVYGPRQGAVSLPEGSDVAPEDVTVHGMRVMGEYYAPEPVARVLNNYLSPGLRGDPLYDAYQNVNNALNQAQLGFSFFHGGFTSLDAAISEFSVGLQNVGAGRLRVGLPQLARGATGAGAVTSAVKGLELQKAYLHPEAITSPELQMMVDALRQAGGRVRQDSFYDTGGPRAFLEAVRHHEPVNAARTLLPAITHLAAAPVMRYIVPAQKLGVFYSLAEHTLATMPKDATYSQKRAALARDWDSVDNRLGQLVYDNIFWNRTFKDLSMAGVRAVGWNVGTFREILGGGKDYVVNAQRLLKQLADKLRGRPVLRGPGADPEFTNRMAYVLALPIIVGLMGAVLQYLLTGKGPRELKDYFFPRTGRKDSEGNDERVQLPSYMRDVVGWWRHGPQTAKNKLAPTLSAIAEMLSNENFYGDQIRNKDDGLVQQLDQERKYLVNLVTPLAVRNLQESGKRSTDTRTKVSGFFGVTVAPRDIVRSPAQDRIMEYAAGSAQRGATPEEAEARAGKSQLGRDVAMGKVTTDSLDKLESAGTITTRQRATLERGMEQDLWLKRFTGLSVDRALVVYKLGTPAEQENWYDALDRKLDRAGRGSEMPKRPQP